MALPPQGLININVKSRQKVQSCEVNFEVKGYRLISRNRSHLNQ